MTIVKKSAYYKACRTAQHSGETNDCSVRAFAVAADVTYTKSHAIHAHFGRENGKGTYWDCSEKVAKMLGMVEWNIPALTLQSFIRKYPKGSFWIARSGHAFAVVDGIVYDWATGTGPRSRVVKVFKLHNEGE